MDRMLRKVWLLAGLGVATGPVLAQRPAAPFRGRLLVGVQAAYYPRQARVAPYYTGSDRIRPWPVLVQVGYRSFVLGTEVGLLLRTTPVTITTYAGYNGTETARATGSLWAVPINNRVRLAPWRRPQPWRLDGELGVMLAGSSYESTSTFTDARTGQQSQTTREQYEDFDLQGQAGLGFSYQLTPQFNLTADARASTSIFYTLLAFAFGSRSYSAPVGPACSLGATYVFGKP